MDQQDIVVLGKDRLTTDIINNRFLNFWLGLLSIFALSTGIDSVTRIINRQPYPVETSILYTIISAVAIGGVVGKDFYKIQLRNTGYKNHNAMVFYLTRYLKARHIENTEIENICHILNFTNITIPGDLIPEIIGAYSQKNGALALQNIEAHTIDIIHKYLPSLKSVKSLTQILNRLQANQAVIDILRLELVNNDYLCYCLLKSDTLKSLFKILVSSKVWDYFNKTSYQLLNFKEIDIESDLKIHQRGLFTMILNEPANLYLCSTLAFVSLLLRDFDTFEDCITHMQIEADSFFPSPECQPYFEIIANLKTVRAKQPYSGVNYLDR